ncbi:MAG: CPBP family intramembrane metalloprotease [Clostridia bacterium]|nr:CPBP family intramembrane metalloprotease [Clostridia bacterium]
MEPLLNERKGGLFYSIAAVVPVFAALAFSLILVATGLQNETDAPWYLYAQFLLTQIPFALLLAVFLKREKIPLREIGVKGTKARYFVLAVLMQVGIFFALGSVNEQFVSILYDAFGYIPPETKLPPMEGFGIVGVLFVVAVLPAICEELIFRGVMVNSTKKMGFAFCVLVNGVLFSLFHENPAQTIYQFLCGCIFALVAYRSGSVLPTMLSHFLNNAFVVVCQKFGIVSFEGMGWYPVAIILGWILLVGGILWLVFERREEKKTGDKKGFFLAAALGIAVCAILWLANFFSYLL